MSQPATIALRSLVRNIEAPNRIVDDRFWPLADIRATSRDPIDDLAVKAPGFRGVRLRRAAALLALVTRAEQCFNCRRRVNEPADRLALLLGCHKAVMCNLQ
jgi:hypothetical protein